MVISYFPAISTGLVNLGKRGIQFGLRRRAEQARHSCKSTTFARLSGEASPKEQGVAGSEQASDLIIQRVNRESTGGSIP
jgi:hypothetical protein